MLGASHRRSSGRVRLFTRRAVSMAVARANPAVSLAHTTLGSKATLANQNQGYKSGPRLSKLSHSPPWRAPLNLDFARKWEGKLGTAFRQMPSNKDLIWDVPRGTSIWICDPTGNTLIIRIRKAFHSTHFSDSARYRSKVLGDYSRYCARCESFAEQHADVLA